MGISMKADATRAKRVGGYGSATQSAPSTVPVRPEPTAFAVTVPVPSSKCQRPSVLPSTEWRRAGVKPAV